MSAFTLWEKEHRKSSSLRRKDIKKNNERSYQYLFFWIVDAVTIGIYFMVYLEIQENWGEIARFCLDIHLF